MISATVLVPLCLHSVVDLEEGGLIHPGCNQRTTSRLLEEELEETGNPRSHAGEGTNRDTKTTERLEERKERKGHKKKASEQKSQLLKNLSFSSPTPGLSGGQSRDENPYKLLRLSTFYEKLKLLTETFPSSLNTFSST